MERFSIHYNAFNGAEVQVKSLAIDLDTVAELVGHIQRQKKDLIWVSLSLQQSSCVPLFTAHGFVFHLCDERQLTLICRLTADTYAPFAPTHTLGVGGIVQNADGEVLLIRDRMMGGQGFKLPGGYVDLGEPVADACEREVYEETGINAQFDSMVGLISNFPHQHGKGNLYLVCRLLPQTEQINIQDTQEIEAAVWMNPDAFIADHTSSRFHRHLIHSLLNRRGLERNDFVFDGATDKLREIFLTS